MKNLKKQAVLITAIVGLILVVVAGAIVGILNEAGVINSSFSTFLLMGTIFMLGAGVVVTAYGSVRKSGSEIAIGLLLLTIGVLELLIGFKVKWVITLIVVLAMLMVCAFIVILVALPKLHVERTNEREDYVPYMQKLQEQKEEEKVEEENKPLPKLKSFKDSDDNE